MITYSNNRYIYYTNSVSGLRTRIGNRSGVCVIDTELYVEGFNDAENTGWQNSKSYSVESNNRIRSGLRHGAYSVDAEITTLGFGGAENIDWQPIIFRGFTPDYYACSKYSAYAWRMLHRRGDVCVFRHGTDPNYESISVSLDGGETIANTVDWNANYYDAGDISAARITAEGNIIIFSRKTAVHVSTNNGMSYAACTVLDAAGDAYVYHTPADADYPGGYWQMFNGFVEHDGVIVFGNYGNSGTGASPTNMWYSINGGVTWKVFYTFGQSLAYRDDGSIIGGTTGTLLGDASNPLVTRHIHGVNLGSDGAFYACTGDIGAAKEMHFMKCVYDSIEDSWTVTDLLNDTMRAMQRMRGIGVYEYNGYIYWGSDGNPVGGNSIWNGEVIATFGLYRSLTTDINDASKHETLVSDIVEMFAFVNGGGRVIASPRETNYYHLSYNNGQTWETYIKEDSFTLQPAYYDDTYDLFVGLNARVVDIGKTAMKFNP